MRVRVESTALNGIVVLIPEVFEDARGFFMESFRADTFKELGLPREFVQDNHSGSVKNVIRGLHFQYDPPMGKLIRVTYGSAFVVAVDVRKGSPTVGQWYGLEVSADNRKQVWAPAGFARGFCALSDKAEIQYKCTALYNPQGEAGIRWNDPQVGIQWPIKDALLSEKDRTAMTLAQWLASPLSNLLKY
jgi:dTDP-4-dehydrorhamnose 3,5-epimerase